MSKYASILAMQRAIINYINSKIPKDINRAQTGTVKGDSILIGNKKYRADYINDMFYQDGDSVVCLLPQGGNFAAVVGKV